MNHFICKIRSGDERKTLAEAAKRCTEVWLPFEFASTRPTHKGKKRARVTVRPIINYLFCLGTTAQREHMLQLRGVSGPVWFVPDHELQQVDLYKRQVETIFDANRNAWMANARQFHCQFKRGQTVRLRQNGLDLFQGRFECINPDGTYSITGPLGRVTAEPGNVAHA